MTLIADALKTCIKRLRLDAKAETSHWLHDCRSVTLVELKRKSFLELQ